MEFKTNGLNLDTFKITVSPKNTPTVLGCLLLKLDGDLLTAIGYDGITLVTETFDVEGLEDGTALVEFVTFSKITRRKCHVYTNTGLTVKGRTTATLPMVDVALYPELPTVNFNKTVEVDPVTFTQAVSKAKNIVSGASEDLNMAHFEANTLIAMDGNAQNARRLLVCEMGDQLNLSIDARLLGQIKFGTDDIQINTNHNAVQLKVGRKTFLTPFMRGSLPNYQALLKADYPVKVTFNRAELHDILSDLGVFGDVVGIEVSDTVKLSSQGELGSPEGHVHCDIEGVGFGQFDLKHLQAGIQMVSDSVVHFEMGNGIGLIRGFNFTYIFVGRL